jgi:hypothetical protein
LSLSAEFAEGAIAVAPIELRVNDGTIRLAPVIDLGADEPYLMLETGQLVESVQITPATCDELFMYISPLVARAAEVDGSCSIYLHTCRVPFSDPAAGADVEGELTIHDLAVDGPGPLLKTLATKLNLELPMHVASGTAVPFRVVDGRVYHRDLEWRFRNVTIRTRGWVGLDRTLGLRVETPIPPGWLPDEPRVRAALADQVITVPVGGTFSRPKIDLSQLDEILVEAARKAGVGLIREEAGALIRRLLGGEEE